MGSSGSHFKITDDDKLWVEENFRWLKSVFGYPNKMEEQVLLDPKFFPATFATQKINIESVIDDLCKLLDFPAILSHLKYSLICAIITTFPIRLKGEHLNVRLTSRGETTRSLLPTVCKSIPNGLYIV